MHADRCNNCNHALRLIILAVLIAAPSSLFALDNTNSTNLQSRHNFFLGLAWSADLGVSSWSNLGHPTIDSITSIVTLGDRSFLPFLPIRGRILVGWFPGHPFRIGGGVEIALLELLNQYDARGFGLYAFLDGIFLIDSSPTFVPRAMLGLLIPLMPTGGICVAAGVTRGGKPAVTLTLMNGGYPQ